MSRSQKVNKTDILNDFKDRLIGEWVNKSYEEIRVLIFKETGIEILAPYISNYCKNNDLKKYREAKVVDRKKINIKLMPKSVQMRVITGYKARKNYGYNT
jgi:CO dehydrogenase/acetyl-CoA synthase gamma subunit (corrinoid Fe-S protein)